VLPPNRHSDIDSLLSFAEPPLEIASGIELATKEPEKDDEAPAPEFIEDLTAVDTQVFLLFRAMVTVPDDLVVLMPDRMHPDRYFEIFRRRLEQNFGFENKMELASCRQVTSDLCLVSDTIVDLNASHVSPWVEVRWAEIRTLYPVRFDSKETLPIIPGARKLTEAELIEYFLSGREPWNIDGAPFDHRQPTGGSISTASEETGQILSYFIRHFVEALPGLEAEVKQATYSAPALSAALRGPTGVIELAKRVASSLAVETNNGNPSKTVTSIGFQLLEIILVLQRCRAAAPNTEVGQILEDGIEECERLLEEVIRAHRELDDGLFLEYRKRLLAEVGREQN
jgi:hypothetical protein